MTDGADWQKDWQRRFQRKGADRMPKETDCRQPADEELLQGIALFNDEEWFECHEALEELWNGEQGLVRDLYQGILQVAVALHHWRNGNYGGAMLLFVSGVRLLRHVEPDCLGVDVAGLIAATGRVREALAALGEERMHELDRGLIPRIRMRRT
jgi:uncharacterized protein